MLLMMAMCKPLWLPVMLNGKLRSTSLTVSLALLLPLYPDDEAVTQIDLLSLELNFSKSTFNLDNL